MIKYFQIWNFIKIGWRVWSVEHYTWQWHHSKKHFLQHRVTSLTHHITYIWGKAKILNTKYLLKQVLFPPRIPHALHRDILKTQENILIFQSQRRLMFSKWLVSQTNSIFYVVGQYISLRSTNRIKNISLIFVLNNPLSTQNPQQLKYKTQYNTLTSKTTLQNSWFAVNHLYEVKRYPSVKSKRKCQNHCLK